MSSKSDPAKKHYAVSPSDAAGFPGGACRALYIGTGGDAVIVVDGVTCTYRNLPNGQILSVEATQVKSTGTTATDIVALY
jgi:hypothetical protein